MNEIHWDANLLQRRHVNFENTRYSLNFCSSVFLQEKKPRFSQWKRNSKCMNEWFSTYQGFLVWETGDNLCQNLVSLSASKVFWTCSNYAENVPKLITDWEIGAKKRPRCCPPFQRYFPSWPPFFLLGSYKNNLHFYWNAQGRFHGQNLPFVGAVLENQPGSNAIYNCLKGKTLKILAFKIIHFGVLLCDATSSLNLVIQFSVKKNYFTKRNEMINDQF